MEKVDICEQCSREYCEKWNNDEVANKEITKMVSRIEEVKKWK